jgi:hypothetical protein
VETAGFRLGVDFGTSNTVAVLRWPDGRVKPLLFDGSPLLPSAVFVDEAGTFSVGRDALDSARMRPSRLEPNPKRSIDDGYVLLGDREVAVPDLIAAVLRRVADEAYRTAGQRPAVVTLTCPAAWGTPRRRILLAAAAQAGLGDVRLVEEPVAAATYFAHMLGQGMPAGSAVVVYDFGGGTFDVSLVERTTSGFRIVAVAGRADIGGLDLDEGLVDRIGQTYGPTEPAAWGRLARPQTRQERRLRRLFRDDVRGAKERLSRHPVAEIHIPGLDRDAHVTREEFEELARPYLNETVRLTAEVMRSGGFPRDRIAGVFLVGGTSRIPLVATLVHQGLRIPPTAIEQPELVVGEGSLLVQSVVAMSGTPVPTPTTSPVPSVSAVATARIPAPAPRPIPALPPEPRPQPTPLQPTRPVPTPTTPSQAPDRPRSRRWVVAGVLAAVLAVAVVAAVSLWPEGNEQSLPAACTLATDASGGAALPAGQPAADLQFSLPPGWEDYLDPAGFRISRPPQWERFGSTPCFGNQGEGRYLSIAEWRQSDTDMVGYWTTKETALRASLTGYQRKVIKPRENYWNGAADWEFVFSENGEQMHAIGVAVRGTGERTYGYFWVTKDSVWTNNVQDFTRVTGTFRPAR